MVLSQEIFEVNKFESQYRGCGTLFFIMLYLHTWARIPIKPSIFETTTTKWQVKFSFKGWKVLWFYVETRFQLFYKAAIQMLQQRIRLYNSSCVLGIEFLWEASECYLSIFFFCVKCPFAETQKYGGGRDLFWKWLFLMGQKSSKFCTLPFLTGAPSIIILVIS